MRICLIGPTYPYRGGIAHYTTLLAKALQASGEVLLISFSKQYPSWLFPGKSDQDPSSYPIKSDAEFILNPLNPIRWWKTLQRIKEWQPEIVVLQWWHPFFTPAWAFLTYFFKKLPDAPRLAVICHNVKPHEKGNKLMQTLLPMALKTAVSRADYFIVHSTMDGSHLQTILPTAVYTVTPHPTYADLGNHLAPLPIKLPENKPLLLFCGFIRPYKGVDILLDAFAQLDEQINAHLLIAGEFWQNGEGQIQAQIEQLGLDKRVTIINHYLPDEQLATLIKDAEVVILPYRSATQSGIVQLAFGHHCPVITTDVGGLAEAVSHEKTGLIVPPENPQALAQAIETYLNQNLKAQFVENIKIENGRFSWQTLVEKIMMMDNQ